MRKAGEVYRARISLNFELNAIYIPPPPGELFLVLVLSPEDGRQHIVETAVSVCKAVLQKRVKIEDINIDFIDKKLTGEFDTTGTGHLVWSWSAME